MYRALVGPGGLIITSFSTPVVFRAAYYITLSIQIIKPDCYCSSRDDALKGNQDV